MQEKSKIPVYFKAALVFMVLFVLPLGSIYFFTKGREFNRAVFKELSDKGKVLDFSTVNQNNLPISSAFLYGKVGVVNFLDGELQKAKSEVNQIGKVHSSFDDTEDVYFISFVQRDSNRSLLERAMDFGIEDSKQWSLAELDAKQWDEMTSKVFRVPDGGDGIVLLDTSLTIRHYYDTYTDSMIGNLVLHISKVIPKQKRRGL